MTAAEDLVRNAGRAVAICAGLSRAPHVPLPRLVWVDPQAELDALIAAVRTAAAPPRERRPRPAGRAPVATAGPASWATGEEAVARPDGDDRPRDVARAAGGVVAHGEEAQAHSSRAGEEAQAHGSRAGERRRPALQVRPRRLPWTAADDPPPPAGAPAGGTTREVPALTANAPAGGTTRDLPGDARPPGEPAGARMAPAWSRGRPQQVGDVPAWTAGETHPAGDAPAWTAGEPHPASDVPARSIDDPQQTSEAAADAAVHTRDLSALPAGAPPAPAQGVAAEDAAADRRRDDSRGIAGVPDDGFGATSDPGPGSTSGETAGSILPDGIPLAGGDELMVRRQEATAADTASEHRPLSRLALGPGELAAVAAEIGAETQAPLLREEPGSARSGAVDLDGLMNRLVTELELEYLRLYGTGELGR